MATKQRSDGSWRRTIGKNTTRRMLMWAHYKFKMRLMEKAKHHGKLVVIVNEAYTSKTCTSCGSLNPKLGGSKTFRCVSAACGAQLDRDANGARNIWLRNVASRCANTA